MCLLASVLSFSVGMRVLVRVTMTVVMGWKRFEESFDLRRASGGAGAFDEINDLIESIASQTVGHYPWRAVRPRIHRALPHHIEIYPHVRRQVDLVDNE